MIEKSINIQVHDDFSHIFEIISFHRQRVSKTVDDESLRMIWEVGAYVSSKLKTSEWGAHRSPYLYKINKERYDEVINDASGIII